MLQDTQYKLNHVTESWLQIITVNWTICIIDIIHADTALILYKHINCDMFTLYTYINIYIIYIIYNEIYKVWYMCNWYFPPKTIQIIYHTGINYIIAGYMIYIYIIIYIYNIYT